MNAMQQFIPGVFAFVQADGSWFINNTGLVCSGEAVVCIDACATEQRTRGLLTAIAEVTEHPVDILVNTHHHPDHTNGNGLIGARTIIAQARCRDELAEILGPPPPGVFEPVHWGQIEPRLPNVAFNERLTLHAGEHRIELIHFGLPAHTTNDLIAWLPDHGVLFAGDLAFNGSTPFALSGSVSGWLETMAQLAELSAEIVVPGHGPVGGPELLRQTTDYLEFVRDAAEAAYGRNLTALESAAELDLGQFAALSDSERIVGNLRRALAELGGLEPGGPIDHPSVFADMVAFNGGEPLRCVA